MRTRMALVATLFCSLGLGGCQGGGLTGQGGAATGSPDSGQRGNARTAGVAVSPQDMAPVNAYFRAGPGGSNTRWILGDVVDVVASREYFSSLISINRGPFVRRTDSRVGEDMVVTLSFLGTGNQASAANNPRIQIGTGVTVTAYRTLRLRLTATRDARVPVRLHITARGDASRGHRENIIQKAPVITMGGSLVRSGQRWVWNPIES